MVVSAEQKALIQGAWTPIYAGNRFQLGVDIFAHFFKAHPNYANLFPSLVGVPNPSTSVELRGHAIRVLTGINYFVAALDEKKPVIMEMIHNMARSHKPRKLTREHFAQFAPVLFDTIGVSGPARDAFLPYYNFIADNLFAEMGKL
uniref:Hemoglobin n=1 Tax=Ophiactis simplex TaxID=533354 RepID=W6FIG9_9ECHI|nr:hemoglobin [Ophiactis simplex]AHN50408.1 hemoglobin [Ophiactis simplex]